jgi:hypothetical protein
MKRAFVVLMALLVTSCIDVDDFGEYWGKARVDRAFSGSWKRISPPLEVGKSDLLQKLKFGIKDNAYEVVTKGISIKEDSGKAVEESETLYPFKTLEVGHYHFLITYDANKKKGQMHRYEVNGNIFAVYGLQYKAACEFFQNNYPDAKNIQHYGHHGQWGPECRIRSVDNEIYKILSAIPDNETYWGIDAKFQKSP